MDLNLRNEVAPDENEEVPPNNAASDLGTDNRDDLVDGDDGDEGDDDERAAATAAGKGCAPRRRADGIATWVSYDNYAKLGCAETIAEKLSKLAGEEGDGLSAAALRHQLSKAELKELSAAFNVLARDKAAQHQRGNQGRFKDQVGCSDDDGLNPCGCCLYASGSLINCQSFIVRRGKMRGRRQPSRGAHRGMPSRVSVQP